MDRDALLRRLLSPGGFALVALFFLFPFITVSCSSPAKSSGLTMTFTGADLVADRPAALAANPEVRAAMHMSSTKPGPFEELIDRPDGFQPLLVVTAVLVVLGGLAALVPWLWWRALTSAALAGLAGILLIGGGVLARRTAGARLSGANLQDILGDDRQQVRITTSFAFGFWLALIMLAGLAAGWLVVLVRESRRRPGSADGADAGPATSP